MNLLHSTVLLLSLLGFSHACDGVDSTTGSFTGAEGIQIQYIEINTVDQSRGALLILAGAGSGYLQECHLVNEVKDLGFAIYMMDHRGNGFSERLLDDPIKFHIDSFDNYLFDIKTFVDNFIKPNHSKVFAWGQSMAGAMLTKIAEEDQNFFDALVLSSPMHQINTSNAGFPEWLSLCITGTLVFFCQGSEYAPGQGPYVPEQDVFEDNFLTSDRERFEQNREINQMYPMGGATNNWVHEAIHATDKIRKNANKLTVPILILQAELDLVVENPAQNEVCNAAQSCTLVVMQGSKHHAFLERDEIRNVALNDHFIPFLLSQ